MKRLINTFAVLALLMTGFYSCTNDDTTTSINDEISNEVLQQIKALGFSIDNVIKEDDHYIVEGDIVLHPTDFQRTDLHTNSLRIAEVEQYRTTNLVTGTPRTILVWLDSKFASKYSTALNDALGRYNAENLSLTFQRTNNRNSAHIRITTAARNASYLASAGFPTSTGNPYNSIKVNNTYLDNNGWNNSSIASILAHEIGHCIGFRHTDYMDRSYSCGGSYYNEGASSVGAVHIPGTPTGPDANSWMLSCIGKDVNRPFNNNDKVALDYLY